MAYNTKIEWARSTIQPVTGCSPVSEGCLGCYAARLAATRLKHHPNYVGLAVMRNGRPQWTGEVRFNPSELEKPQYWKKPRRIFPCSMSDIFHESLSHSDRNQIFEAMDAADWHKYLLLTKRPDIALDFDKWRDENWLGYPHTPWKDHIWLGVTIEHPKYGYRADYLRKIPAAVRFLSLEPLLADFSEYPGILDDMNWCIVGGESGPRARPMHPDWVRSVRDQCVEAGVPWFFKQWGEFIGVDYILDNDFLEAGGIWECSDGRQHDEIKKRPQGDDRWIKVGKKAAGRLLDGREHNEYPTPGR